MNHSIELSLENGLSCGITHPVFEDMLFLFREYCADSSSIVVLTQVLSCNTKRFFFRDVTVPNNPINCFQMQSPD